MQVSVLRSIQSWWRKWLAPGSWKVPSVEGPDGFCRLLFILIVAGLGIEFVELPSGISFYKLIIVPASSLGFLYLLVRGVRISSLAGVLPLLVFVPLMVLSYLKWGVRSSLVSAIGFIPFFVFMYYYLVNFGWPIGASVSLAMWSLPHLGSLVLFYFGLSNEAFTDSIFRFDGIHSDPNFMVLFVLASTTGKAILFRISPRAWVRWVIVMFVLLDIFMIGMGGSRGGALGLFITFFTLSMLRIGFFKSVLFYLVLALLIYFSFGFVYYNLPDQIAASPFWATVDRLLYSDKGDLNASSSNRYYLWDSAVRLMENKGAMIGYTIENFRKKHWLYPHNSFLDAALESGLPGLFVLLGIIGFSAYILIRNIHKLDLGGVQALLLGASFWATLLFLSSFSTKVFWLSIIVPYALAVRYLLLGSSPSGTWRANG